MSPGPLGTFDPTLLLNGIYEMQLVVTDTGGTSLVAGPLTVVVEGAMKIGAFSLAFEDLKIPVAGIPINVTRTYDSRYPRVGDFGPGWRLALNNIRVQKNRNLGTAWWQTPQSGNGIQFYDVLPIIDRIVTVVFPDGETHRFKAGALVKNRIGDPDYTSFATVVSTGKFRFYPIGDTTSTLEPLDATNTLADTFWIAGTGDQDLRAADPASDPFAATFNTSRYRLTTKDGTVYLLDEALGLLRMTDLNGNTLELNRDVSNRVTGITSTQTVAGSPVVTSVTIHRDATGRVDYVRDPASHDLDYAYDLQGRLQSFTDRELHSTQFFYENTAFPYYLTKILDPRGIAALRSEFDASGKLIKQIDADGNETVFTRGTDATGRYEKVKDRLGNAATFYYDDRGNVVQKTDALGGITSYTYDANDNQLSMTDPLGHTSTTAYDARKNLLSQSDPLSNTTTFTYDAGSRPLTITDARGKVTTNIYNATGNLTSTTDAKGNVTSFTYDSSGRLTQVKDALNQTTITTYTAAGYQASSTDALGHTTSWTYDANGNRLTQTVTRTQADSTTVNDTTSYTYDTENRLTKTTFPDGSFASVAYNAFGKQASSTDALGHVTSFTYDARGNLTTTTYADASTESSSYDLENRVVSATDRAGHTTTTTYDALGRATKVTYADATSTSTTYDAAGRVLTSTDAGGNVTSFGYDLAGRRTAVTDALTKTTTSSFDANGSLTAFTDALNHTTGYTYDDAGLRTVVTFPDSTTQLTTYDALGRKLTATDQAGVVTRNRYDALGRLIEVRQYLDQTLAASDSDYHLTTANSQLVLTAYGYDELGHQVSQTDALGRVTQYSYDSLGRRIQRKLPGNQIESYSYDAGGNVTGKTDFNGYTTAFVYDTLNRLTEKRADATHPSLTLAHAPAKYTYSYNALGQRVGATVISGPASGATTLYSETVAYDSRNRPTSRATTNGTLTYSYTAQGNVASTHSNDLTAGLDVTYTYDALNRLAQAASRDPADGVRKATTYGYDDVGNLGSIARPNGVTSLYAYDSLNRLTTLTVDHVGTLLASYTYTLNASGHRTSVAELNSRTHTYGYDSLYRLKSETIVAGVADSVPAGTINYVYDAVGNRLSRNSSVAGVPSTSSAFDTNDRLASDSYDANGNTKIGVPANGATLNSGDIYDFENRLIRRSSALAAQSSTIDVVYDADGNRVSETVGAQTISFLVDLENPTGYAQVVEERVNGTLVRTYAYGHALLSQTQANLATWVTTYYSADGHGSTRLLTDSSGTITDAYAYEAFGTQLSHTTTNAQPTFNRYRYTGEQFDDDLGLYYLRARYLNPDSGRFWSMDSYEGSGRDPMSLHKYLYANANPVGRIDPSGHFSLVELAETMMVQGYVRAMAYPRIFSAVSFAVSLLIPAEVQIGLPSFGLGTGLAAVESAAAKELPALRRAWLNADTIKEAGAAGRSFEAWVGKVLQLEKNTLAFKDGLRVPGGTAGGRIPDFFVSGARQSIVEVKSASFSVSQAQEFAKIAVGQGLGLTYVFLKNPGAAAVKELRAAVAKVTPDLEVAVNVVFP